MVDTFDPTAEKGALDAAEVRGLIENWGEDAPHLQELEQARYAHLVRHPGWQEGAGQFSAVELDQLIRIFTVGEQECRGWSAGDKSAVIPIVAELKRQGAYAKETTQWIKAHTDNKFLPHGSLAARL